MGERKRDKTLHAPMNLEFLELINLFLTSTVPKKRLAEHTATYCTLSYHYYRCEAKITKQDYFIHFLM